MTKTSTDAQIVGSVSFINGDAQQFTDAKEYLDCIREELPHEATTGFRFRTITQDPTIRKAVEEKADVIKAYVVKDGALVPFEMTLGALTDDEREIIRKGCLINYYRG